jgi:hypothetical protein
MNNSLYVCTHARMHMHMKWLLSVGYTLSHMHMHIVELMSPISTRNMRIYQLSCRLSTVVVQIDNVSLL